MVYVCLAEAAVLVVAVIAFAGLLRSMSRAHARREDLLVNQLLHAVDKAWQPAPSELHERSKWSEAAEEKVREWYASPEQEPVY